MRRHLNELIEQIRLADALDIGIVTLLIYVGLVWLRHRSTQSLGVMIALLAALYVLAGWLEMYLTTMIFQYGIIAILFSIIVIFQQDIRHGIERLVSSRWLRQGTHDSSDSGIIDTIVESVAALARDQIGALIVFPGREPLTRHMRGGVLVDAEISEPLLLSIFHPQSPGHDGAVLIEDSRIRQLSLHLPLSSNLTKVQGSGTRHTAALGLSECCDALVVVVSEERGTITTAHGGELTEVDPAGLAQRLEQFLASQTVTNDLRGESGWDRWFMGFASLSLAVLLWILFAYQTATLQRTIIVPIEYRNLAADWVVAEPRSSYAEVTLVGSDKAFKILDVSAITVSLELEDVQLGIPKRLSTEQALTNVPSELSVNEIVPRWVDVIVRKK
ncbi:diadenylate cyclase [Novipirellula caenicola]|uniref:Diadenylate cyclase n=1 Tax=Novipirellula caenicola TaxID=1536901 RepID=A0ABP9VWU4_9BACT